MGNPLRYKRYHLVGIQGVGMAALALILRERGALVAGSDVGEVFLTGEMLKKHHVKIYDSFDPHVLKDTEAVIYSGAHGGRQNKLVEAAIGQSIPVFQLAQVLGALSKEKKTVAVAGCHGKTTTTAMLGFIGTQLKNDMSYYVGAAGVSDMASGRWSGGEYFAVEADEYVSDPSSDLTPKFLHLSPQSIIVTNIDFDHPDVYENIGAVEQAYRDFFKTLVPSGFLLVNGDDASLLRLVRENGQVFYTYGANEQNNFVTKNIIFREHETAFSLFYQEKNIGTYKLSVAGMHNVYNAAAVASWFYLINADMPKVKEALFLFSGAQRRLELVAHYDDKYLFDDYAHHPTEIAAGVVALKNRFPDYIIVVIFQPHTYSRTEALEEEFIQALHTADYAGILPIFSSAREKESTPAVTSETIVQKAQGAGRGVVEFLPTEAALIKFIRTATSKRQKFVVVTMGAGDIYKKLPIIEKELKKIHKQ